MEYSNEISSNKEEFDLSLLNDEITSIHKAIDDREKKSSDEDRDEVRSVRRRKIRIISKSENDSDTAKNTENSEWITCIGRYTVKNTVCTQ